MDIKFLRVGSVCGMIDEPQQSFLYKVRKGLFTKQVKLGARSAAWPAHEIESVLRARMAGKTDDQIRQLVKALEEQRKLPNAFNGKAAAQAAEEAVAA